MEASAVNAPHPDDEAAAFFGDEEPAAPAAEQETKQAEDTRSPEQRAEDAYQYREAHGEDHTVEQIAAHEALTQDAEFEAAAPQTDAERAAEVQGDDTQERLRAIAQREAAEKAAAESEPQAEAEPEPETGTPDPGSDAAPTDETEGGDAPAADESKKSGDLTREYIVFNRVQLNERVLKALLERLEKGDQPEPLIAWVELDRREGRNVNHAVGASFTKHTERLGPKADLAAVSSRSFQVRHIEPKEVVQSSLSIT